MPISSYSHSPKHSKSEAGNTRVFFFALLVLLVAGGGIFLATRDVPPPSHSIEKAISNDRFFK